jgi:hypothetical protein
MIVAKYTTIPLKNANSNSILDPNEQFDIFACPKNTIVGYQGSTAAGGYALNFFGRPNYR